MTDNDPPLGSGSEPELEDAWRTSFYSTFAVSASPAPIDWVRR
jgi:hypothetical protein